MPVATLNSWANHPSSGSGECIMRGRACNRRRVPWLLLAGAVAGLFWTQLFADQTNTSTNRPDAATLARENYTRARASYEKNPGDPVAAIEAGRTTFEWAEFASRKGDRAILAEQGIEACERALSLQSNSGTAHYYLAMNLGQLARTKGWGALKLVSQLQREFEAAAKLEPKVDFAGPYRNLGYLYRDTPSIGSVGDKHLARQNLERAVELAPDYPENRIALAEGLVKWGERNLARNEVAKLDELLPRARERLSAPNYGPAWADWDERLAEVRSKLKEHKKFLGIFGGDE